MTNKTKSFLWGFIPSLILPLMFIFLFIYVRYSGTINFWRVIQQMFEYEQLSALLAVGAFPNLFLFLFSMNRENWPLGRGVIGATLLYGVAVMLIKFL